MSDQSEKKITDVEVLFPESHGNKLNQYKRYKIKFSYKGTEMEIYRRYSDFAELRKNLRKYLPFHYILPLHHKATISNTDEKALQFRVDELQKFLNFILKDDDFLDCDSFWKFFDSNLKDTKVGQILNQMGQVTWEYTEFILRKRYADKFKIEYSDEMEEKIIKFKERIDISVSFCKSFYQSIKAHVNNLKETPLFSSQSTFFNLLAIHYSNQNDSSTFEEVEKSCKSVTEQDVKGSWKKLEKRAKMISVEMNCLLEIYKDFSNLVSQKNHELTKSKKLNQSIKDLENSDVRTVGFFKKKSKGDKLNDLHHDLQLSEEKIKLLQKLIAVASDIIMNEQLQIIKKRKQKRFKNALDDFAQEQSQFLQPKTALWDVLKKANEKMFGQDVQEIDLGDHQPEQTPKEEKEQLFIIIQLLKIESMSLTNYLDLIGQPLMYLQLFLTKSEQIQQTFNNLSSTNLAFGWQVNQKNAFQIWVLKLFKVYEQLHVPFQNFFNLEFKAFKNTCQPRPVKSLIVNKLLDNYKQSFQSKRISSEKCFAKIIPPLLPIMKREKNILLILNYKLMWYKFFNKESFKLRLWRTYNLNFDYRQSMQAKPLARTQLFQTFHKICGHRQILQLYLVMSFVSLVGMYNYYNESRYGEETRRKIKEEKKKDLMKQKEAYKELNKNRFGIATNPGESIEVFSKFIENGYAIDQLSLFNEHKQPQTFSQDIIQGLDGPLNTEDYNLMEYVSYYSKKH